MKQKELTKTFMMISYWKGENFVSMIYTTYINVVSVERTLSHIHSLTGS